MHPEACKISDVTSYPSKRDPCSVTFYLDRGWGTPYHEHRRNVAGNVLIIYSEFNLLPLGSLDRRSARQVQRGTVRKAKKLCFRPQPRTVVQQVLSSFHSRNIPDYVPFPRIFLMSLTCSIRSFMTGIENICWRVNPYNVQLPPFYCGPR